MRSTGNVSQSAPERNSHVITDDPWYHVVEGHVLDAQAAYERARDDRRAAQIEESYALHQLNSWLTILNGFEDDGRAPVSEQSRPEASRGDR